MSKMMSSKDFYSDSPTMKRGEDGKVAVHKGGEKKKEEKVSEADQITSGADGAVRDTTDRHAAERFSMHHEHVHERLRMHHKHAMEHMHSKGHKGAMHDRHESELKAVHKKHETEHKAMHERHETEMEAGANAGDGGEDQQA